MKKYEIMYILRADLEDASRKKEVEKLHNILTKNGVKITKVDEWGVRDFAYIIKDQKKGYYVVLTVLAEADQLNEFSRLIRINENVIRHLITISHGN
ncbi:MAG: 30S ribosomal protein S6 [Bacilli bacterium]|nr:30S ribosomal protein S6 [Bacilli bacterium]